MEIRWCKCKNNILSTEQIQKNLPCDWCQKQHAETFKERFEELGKKEEDNEME